MFRMIFLWSLLMPLVFLSQACARYYSAEAIEAWVVDAETNQPLEGVIVTANWQLNEGTLVGTNSGRQLMVMETITDKNGRFYFPAWGPRKAEPIRDTESWIWMMLKDVYMQNGDDPQLLFFKSGHEFLRLANNMPYLEGKINPRYTGQRNTTRKRTSEWSGKKISLKRFRGSLDEYADHLSSNRGDLSFVFSSLTVAEDCEWTKIPLLLVALHREDVIFKEKNIPNSIPPLATVPGQSTCGSWKYFFREHLQ